VLGANILLGGVEIVDWIRLKSISVTFTFPREYSRLYSWIRCQPLLRLVKGAAIGSASLMKLASANEFAIGDETISDDQVFEDAASHKSSDDDLYDVGRILAEKRGDRSVLFSLANNTNCKIHFLTFSQSIQMQVGDS
jgi:hypothetical protein